MINQKKLWTSALTLACLAGIPAQSQGAERGTSHTPTAVTTTREALGVTPSADSDTVRLVARAWCETMVRGGGRISRIELLSGGKVRCWYKN